MPRVLISIKVKQGAYFLKQQTVSKYVCYSFVVIFGLIVVFASAAISANTA
jgi:hypothetical protein